MGNLQWYDYFRMLIALLALCAFVLSAKRARGRWDKYSQRHRDLWWCLNAFLLIVVEGQIEQIISNIGYGPRTFLTFLVVLICFKAQMRDEELNL